MFFIQHRYSSCGGFAFQAANGRSFSLLLIIFSFIITDIPLAVNLVFFCCKDLLCFLTQINVGRKYSLYSSGI
ncbi:MAG: hypothetical protein D3909_08030 [Candidatus Electrothrix sp. ATG1]|nr:hypothetical protein [Candidatus Electrothrix sp. ATG1]